MTAQDEILASDYRKIVFQHSYFLLSRSLDSFELEQYNLSVFFAITAIEEITNNLYSLTEKYENFDIVNFIHDFFPLVKKLLEDKEKSTDINPELGQIFEKYFKKDNAPSKLSMRELSSQFKMKEHRSHNKKTLKALIHSLSINPEAFRRLGSGFIEFFLFMAERGMIFHYRNLCLYVNVEKESISSPEKIIPKSMAVDIIAIAFETIIELKSLSTPQFTEEEKQIFVEMNLRKKADEFYEKNDLKPIAYVGAITDFLSKKNVIIVDVISHVSTNDELVIYDTNWKHLDLALAIEKNSQRIDKAVEGDRIGIQIKNKVSRRGLLYRVQKDIGELQREGTLKAIEVFMEAEKTGQPPDMEKIRELMNQYLKGIS